MGAIREYIIPRLIVYFLVIYVGVTLAFFIPRIAGVDPVMVMMNRIAAYAEFMDPESVEQLLDTMRELYGLKGSLWEQYVKFLQRIVVGDFGVSLTSFPTPVSDIIWRALPWTIGLLSISTLISWIIGNIAGAVAAYYSEKPWSRILSGFAVVIYPIPYYLMSLTLLFIFGFLIPLFPLRGATTIGREISLNLQTLLDIAYHSILPALSLVITSFGWWFISMKNIAFHEKLADYTQFAELIGLPKRFILNKFVIRNSLLPQITGLSVSLAGIFNGALMTELVFSYPGIGYILYQSILNGDFNLMMGIVIYSIISVSTATLIIDLIYPLIDPRIRYR